MKTLRSALTPFLLVALCTSVAACADTSSGYHGPEAQGASAATASQTANDSSPPKPRLTIQSGEGETLNLPWFVRDVQGWVNEGGAPADLSVPPGN
jgi:hypothetical protein